MQVFAAQSGIASAMHGRWVEGWFGGEWGVAGGALFSQWEVERCNRNPAKKRLHQTKRPVGNNAGRGLLGHLWASFQAAVTSYKSFMGTPLNRGPHQGQELLHFCLNETSARG